MENSLLEIAVSQGVWALLSIFLILNSIKRQDKSDQILKERETKYQEIINRLIDEL
ncbi:MAG: hypothetical protein KAH05_08180 [Clostridiales bacterium]|nr:hypothetical protein [Clostridiales bacterium]